MADEEAPAVRQRLSIVGGGTVGGGMLGSATQRTILRSRVTVDDDPGLSNQALPEQEQPEQQPDLQPGVRIGQYELIRELGRGGMGAVFLARDTKLGRRVAIKFLHTEQPEVTARFILEARATARCSHESIVIIYEVGEHRGQPYMVLEYLQGAPLSKHVKKDHGLSATRAVELILPVVRALGVAHEHNIVHRDLKPDNIFVTDSGTVKVLDFGIAKLVQSEREPGAFASRGIDNIESGLDTRSSYQTRKGAIVGTLPFMSPEQWGIDTVDHRTDIWAVGIILYTMLAGRHPLGNARGRQLVVTAMLEHPMPSIREVCPEVDDDLATIVDSCLIKRKEERIGSARELQELLESLVPRQFTHTLRANQCPYAGLSAFQESDASRFFGRSREILAAVNKLREQPFVAVAGPSGVGKSSFVRAGVVPALKNSGEKWTSLVIRPGRRPLDALSQIVATSSSQGAATVHGDLSQYDSIAARLLEEPGYLGTVLRSRARRKQGSILLFVDQFEELYTLVEDERTRRAFTACLASVADDATAPLRVVLSLRSDFLDRVTEDPYFMDELQRGLFFLTPPGRESMREALIQPAEMVGYTYESPDIVGDMINHLSNTPGALPLLQFAASRLWDMRDVEQRLLTMGSYQKLGGIVGALATHADSVVSKLPPTSQTLARALFLRIITPERTRAVVAVSDLRELAQQPAGADDVDRLIAHLVHARLLTVQTGDAATGNSVEIVHESLISSWPLLRRWLDENQDDAAFLQQVRNAAKQWQAKGRPMGLLWRGEAMEEARMWYRRYQGDLPELQKQYLDAVLALAARAGRRKQIAVVALIAFLGLLVAMAAVALVIISTAQKEATAQANAATKAEAQVREQIEDVRQAQAVAEDERKKAQSVNRQLTEKNDELLAAIAEAEAARQAAEEARQRAEQSKRRARRNRRKAEKNETAAKRAEERAQRANKELKVLLQKAREEAEKRGVDAVIRKVEIGE